MNGIILIDKEKDMTSFDVIAKLKKIFHTSRIGHAGTLDPIATGLLVVMVNEATKLSNYLMSDEKVYEAEMTLGISTDTEDSEGKVIEQVNVQKIEEEDIDSVLQSFLGKSEQIPPMYSAIKQNGKKLYELARSGKTIEREAREINVFSIVKTSPIIYFDNKAKFSFQAKVSKGTYIRTLCVSIGEKLGYPAHMSNLRRISSGTFEINQAYTLNDIMNEKYQLISMLDSLKKFPILEVEEPLYKKIYNGVAIDDKEIKSNEDTIVFAKERKLLAIYKHENNKYKAERVWN